MQEVLSLQQRLKQIRATDGTGWLWGGALSGAGINLFTQQQQPSKKKKDNTESFLELLLSAGIGLAAGGIMKGLTDKEREAEKQKAAIAINNRIAYLNDFISKAEAAITKGEYNLQLIPRYETKIVPKQTEKPKLLLGSFDIGNFGLSEEEKRKRAVQKKLEQQKQEQQRPIQKAEPEMPKVQTTDKLISSRQLKDQQYKALNFQGEWGAFLGQPAIDFKCAVHGKPGEGKSTFCIRLAHYLATNFGNVVYISGEEGFSKTLRDKVVNNKAVTDGLYFADVSSYDEIKKEVPADTFHFIFIDSLDTMKIDAARLLELDEYYKNSALITISQSTKAGKMRGSNEIAHDADITINVEDGVAITTKNRFKERGAELRIFDKGDEQEDSGKIIPFKPRNVV